MALPREWCWSRKTWASEHECQLGRELRAPCGLKLARGVHRRELIISSAIERTAVPLLVLPAPLLKKKGRSVLRAGRADLAYPLLLHRPSLLAGLSPDNSPVD